jgi:hypothetical protein
MTDRLRRIDHLVLAVQDLDHAADFYDRIGFQVGARNRHPWGTENRLVQFSSSFLELITVSSAADIPPHAPHAFSFGAFVRDFLHEREGLAMLALDSADAAADAAAFARDGAGDFAPFSFQRMGRRPDGSEVQVGFSLAFAVDAGGHDDAAFFVSQHHNPDAFWNPLFQQHPNGGLDVTGVTLAVKRTWNPAAFLEAFTGAHSNSGTYLLAGGGVLRTEQDLSTRFRGYRIDVDDLDAAATRLSKRGVPFERSAGRISIDGTQSFSASITFEEASREASGRRLQGR